MDGITKSRLIKFGAIFAILIHIYIIYASISNFFGKEVKGIDKNNLILKETECYFNRINNDRFFIDLLKEKKYKQLQASLISTKCLPRANSSFFEEFTLEKQVPEINNIGDILEYGEVLNLLNMLYITYDVENIYIDEYMLLSGLGIEYSGTMLYLSKNFMETLDKNSHEYQVKNKYLDTMKSSQYQVLNSALLLLKREDIYTEEQLIRLATIFNKNFRILFDNLSEDNQLDIISNIGGVTLTSNIPKISELLDF